VHDRAMDGLTTAVAAVLQATAGDLANSSIEPVSRTPESVQSLLDAGEPGVAYEILCDNLFEDHISAPRHLLVQLQREAVIAGVDGGWVAALLS
jgi:hypothetical protein